MGRELRGRDGVSMSGSEGTGLVGRGPWAFEGGLLGGWRLRETHCVGEYGKEGRQACGRERRDLSKAGWGEAARQVCQGEEGRESWRLGLVPV